MIRAITAIKINVSRISELNNKEHSGQMGRRWFVHSLREQREHRRSWEERAPGPRAPETSLRGKSRDRKSVRRWTGTAVRSRRLPEDTFSVPGAATQKAYSSMGGRIRASE